MNCPHCGQAINPAAVLGAKGGQAKGAAKRRDVDYAALARKSHAARRAAKATAPTEADLDVMIAAKLLEEALDSSREAEARKALSDAIRVRDRMARS